MWFFLSAIAQAHTGSVPLRGQYDWSNLPDLEPGKWVVWEFHPTIVLGCAAWLALYIWLAGPGRTRFNLSPVGPTRRQWRLFILSLLVVFCSLQGPLHELSDYYLFSGHMIQHLAITLIFPPLFILGIPGWMVEPLLRVTIIGRVAKVLTRPVVAFIISTCTLYFWHIPAMYDWALVNHDVHIGEHLTFMTGGVIMWWPICSNTELLPRLRPLPRMAYTFLLTIPMKVLGAIITISDVLIYDFYATQPRVFDLNPMVDQRFGGLIMWIPGGLIFWFAIAGVFFGHYYSQIGPRRAVRSKAEVIE